MMIRLNCQSKLLPLFLLSMLLFIESSYSQEDIFEEKDPDFEVINIPDKWKNESAVIICQKTSYLFDKISGASSGATLTQKEVVRKRIKLLDRAAVEEYSEFYFVATKDLGIRIIKPSGNIDLIDLKDAVAVAKDVSIPGVYKSAYKWEKEYHKVAIAGLEPNDIIDYFTIVEHSEWVNTKEYAFSDVLHSLENSYPVIKQKFRFEINKDLYFNFKASNGSPELIEETQTEETLKLYSFTDSDREKIKDERWSFIYRSTPSIRFQVVYNSDPKGATEYFLGDPGIVKTSVSQEEVAVKVNQVMLRKDKSADKLSRLILKYLSSHKDINTENDIARASYYLYRSMKFTRDKNNFGENDDLSFVKCLAKVFDKKEVSYKVMVTVPRQIGRLEELVLKDELAWFLMVDASGKFLTSPSLNANYGSINYGIEGADAYLVKPHKDFSLVGSERRTIPVSSIEMNGESDKVEVSFSKELDQLSVNHITSVRGHSKESFNSAIIYGDNTTSDRYSLNFSSDVSGISDQKRVRRQRYRSYIAEDFDLVSYEDFTLVKDGRYDDDPVMEFVEKYTIKGLLRKAGKNYIFQAGRLIGTQIEINEAETRRRYDVYSDCPRSFKNEISITIPEGYSVLGIEKLSMNVSNETGSFISKASVEGQVLKIRTTKIYLHNSERSDDWPKMVQFLDAAYDFTQARIVFKKTED
jgi:hypothetical protein